MGDLGTGSLLYSARPTLALDGVDESALAQGLLTMAVEEDSNGLFRCEATFGNWGSHGGAVDFLYFDRQLLDFGRQLTVEMGSGAAAAQVFDGRISAIEGRFPQQRPPEVLVLAEDRFQDLRMKRRTRSFEQVTFDDVASQIASDHGLTPTLDVNSPSYPVLAQVNQSDLAFLRERARAIDAEVWVEGTTLHAQSRAQRNAGQATLTYGQALHEFVVTADVADQRTKVTVSGWDVAAKTALDEDADDAALGAESEGTSGAQTLQSAFGDRPERVVHLTPLTADEARRLAEARFRQLARGFLRGHGIAEGDGRIRVGTKVTLRGVGGLFDGAYYVVHARHAFDGTSGYRTHFAVERPWIGS